MLKTYLSPASSALSTPSFFSCSSRYTESSVFTQYRRDGAAQEAVRRTGRREAAWRTFSREGPPAEAVPTQQWRAGDNWVFWSEPGKGRLRVLFNKSFSTTVNLNCNISILSDYQRKTTVKTGELASSDCYCDDSRAPATGNKYRRSRPLLFLLVDANEGHAPECVYIRQTEDFF